MDEEGEEAPSYTERTHLASTFSTGTGKLTLGPRLGFWKRLIKEVRGVWGEKTAARVSFC